MGAFCALTALNIALGTIKVADLLVVTSPALVMFSENRQPLVRVDDPSQVLLNNSRIQASQITWVEMRVGINSQ